jgi:hypothetical protein
MTSPLLTDLAGVARLADVQRPVASVWRSRFATSADPFPAAVGSSGGRPLFDVVSIAQWLDRTGRGNNPDAVADAAASAAPHGFDFSDPAHIATVDALLTIHATSGEAAVGLSPAELRARATAVDPDDTCLVSEILTADSTWADWADRLADAAYSPLQASRLLELRHAATRSAVGPAGPLTPEAEALLVALTAALGVDRQGDLLLHDGIAASLATELIERVGDGMDVVVPPLHEGRDIRRRRLLDEFELPATASSPDVARLVVARFPSRSTNATRQVLAVIDELVLGMRDDDRAVVLAPASVLIDSVAASDGLVRADVLRSGRVRAIVKLPPGLVTAAPRAALALWVFGREVGDVPIADRFTAVADLADVRLTPAAQSDLTNDVLAAMGSARDVRSHPFRFARLVRTTSLLAAPGSLIPAGGTRRRAARPARDLPALLDRAYADLGDDAPRTMPASAPASTIPSASVAQLIRDRNLRLLPGTRLASDELSEAGWVVVGADELDDPARVGARRVDALTFSERHPSASLTAPGDVVFRTGPTARAWIDPDGSKIVAHPARVLRIDAADPGGLVSELVAGDIEHSPGGPGAWRRWHLRRVAPHAVTPLRTALAELSASRQALAKRITALDNYTDLLLDGVVSGAVTLTDNAADRASDPQ